MTHTEIKFREVVKTGYGETLKKLKIYMEKELSSHYSYSGTTTVALQFKYEGMDVDLLLSPYWETRREYYHDLAQIESCKRLM